MRHNVGFLFTLSSGLCLLGLAAFGCGGSDASSSTTDGDSGEFLFTQTAEGGTFTPVDASAGTYKVAFTGVFPSTIYFSDRPERIVGQAPMDKFLAGLGFQAENPPNAAIVVPNGDGEDDDEIVVVELTKPVWNADAKTLSYDAKILDSATGQLAIYQDRKKTKLPATFTAASVLIDDCPNYSSQLRYFTQVEPPQWHTCPNGNSSDPKYTMGATWVTKKLYCMPNSHKDASNGLSAWHDVYNDAENQWNANYPDCCHDGCDTLGTYNE